MKDYWNTLTVWKKIKLTFTFSLFVLIVIFSFQDWELMQMNLLFMHIQIPLTLLIFSSILIGYFIGIFLNYKKANEKEKEIKRLKIKITDLLKDQKDSL